MRFCKWCGQPQPDFNAGQSGTTTLLADEATGPAIIAATTPTKHTTTELSAARTDPVAGAHTAPVEDSANAASGAAALEAGDEATLIRVADKAVGGRAAASIHTTEPTAAPLPRQKRGILPLVTVAITALALGAGLSVLILQRWYAVQSASNQAGAPAPVVVPVPVYPEPSAPAAPSAGPTAQPSVNMTPALATVPPQQLSPPLAKETPPASPSPAASSAATASAALPPGAPRQGFGEWTGTVIGSVILEFQGRSQSVVGSTPALKSVRFNISDGLPKVPATLAVEKKKGKGRVEIIQQPSAANNYAARVRITNAPGSPIDQYVIRITWEAVPQ